jgi:hypothetical protein
MAANIGGNVSTPGFTQGSAGEPYENEEDEAQILTDQDQTTPDDLITQDENMGAPTNTLESLEDEPADFMRGELDVKEQMDRAADALDSSIRGLQNQGYEDSPRTELGAAFKNTPGGIEEVEFKTDEDLKIKARSGHAPRPKPEEHH